MKVRLREYLLKPFIFFLIGWFILNLIQAFFTPLNNDEAYYWMYSKYLDWGFFDHPPMIAVLIKFGYAVFHNELGVRILIVIGEIIALLIIWSLTDEEPVRKKESVFLFIMLVAIIPVFNIFGFIATPDAPLILFSAVFLLCYKRFLNAGNWQNTLFLGFSMAALMYSKYHGGLLILCVLFSNLRLLKSSRFYLASALAIVLFLPHLYWQYSNGFPSFKYHLIERVSGFNIENMPEYILNLFIIQDPFIFPICIWLIIKNKAKDKFEKALYYSLIGIVIFFLIASFRYHIQPQWTALISVPMVIIMFNKLGHYSGLKKYIS